MKKIIYLASLLLVVATVNVGCEKESNEPETPPVVVQTLEQKYPDWKNLTWKDTKLNNVSCSYPRYYFKIEGNVVTETYIKDANTDTVKTNYNNIEIFNKGTQIKFNNVYYNFEKINNEIIITAGDYKYYLRIN